MEMEDMSLEVAEKDTAAEIAAEAAVADPANRPAKRPSNTRVCSMFSFPFIHPSMNQSLSLLKKSHPCLVHRPISAISMNDVLTID